MLGKHDQVIALRPYQTEALEAIEQTGASRPLLALATGLGKTIVFSELIRRRADLGPALILAHRDELIMQAEDKLRQVWPEAWIGTVKASQDNWHAPVVIGSVQTLSRPNRLARIPPGHFRTVVVDEAHHAAADSYRRVVDHMDAPLTLGVTATPQGRGGGGLKGVWDEVTYSRDILWGITNGYLCDIRGVRVRLVDANFGALKVTRGDFRDGETAEMLRQAQAPRHAVTAYQEHAPGRKTIAFTPTVQLAHEFAGAFNAAGVKAEAVDATTPHDERKAMLRRFHTGETRVMANAMILTEGYDEPTVECILVARPTLSQNLYCQMVGRGTRLHPGKPGCLVLDMVGSTSRLGLVTLPNLFGKPGEHMLDGVGVLAAAGLVSAQLERVDRRDMVLEASAVDLFASRTLAWVATGRDFVLSLGEGMLRLRPADDAGENWEVLHEQRRQPARLLVTNLTLGYAQGVAEDFVRKLGAGAVTLTNPEAPWRSRPASDKQLAFLGRLEGDVPDGLTCGEASDRISAALANEKQTTMTGGR